MRALCPKHSKECISQTKGVFMKKIPMWIEWLVVIVSGVLVGLAFGLMLLGYNLAFLLY
jgi:hypothetical protein